MNCEVKHEKCVTLENVKIVEVEEVADTNRVHDVALAYDKAFESIKRIHPTKCG
jgi:hypothetical protein